MSTNSDDSFRQAAIELQNWIKQLRTETDSCLSEILDSVEAPDGKPDAQTQKRSSASVDRIAERISDVMSAYDDVLRSLGEEPHFTQA